MSGHCGGWVFDVESIYSTKIPVEDCRRTENIKTDRKETYSQFSESECGEPFSPQHIRLDFTPTEDEIHNDNEYQQHKCRKFWKFIQTQRQLKHLRVQPERVHNTPIKSHIVSESISSDDKNNFMDDNGVSMLELIQEKGIISHTFGAMIPQSYCTTSSVKQKQDTQRKTPENSGRCYPCPQDTCPCEPPRQSDDTSSLQSMIKEMEEWDEKHIKSMKPPGPPPPLQHCVLQQVIYKK